MTRPLPVSIAVSVLASGIRGFDCHVRPTDAERAFGIVRGSLYRMTHAPGDGLAADPIRAGPSASAWSE
jgi:hypothetical protein